MPRLIDASDPNKADNEPATYRYHLWFTAHLSDGSEQRYLAGVADTREDAEQRAAASDLTITENPDWAPLH